MTPFDASFEQLIVVEGGYANDPADAGGATMYGITEAVARAAGYTGPMSVLPLSVAREIYRERYWTPLSLDAVAAVSPRLAHELFDSAVHAGPSTAGQWLQRCLNALNDGARLYADLPVTGLVREMTLAALRAYRERRGEPGVQVLLRALNGLQVAHYVTLAERRPTDERFLYGWILNRVVI